MCCLENVVSSLGTDRFCSDLLSYVGTLGTVDHAALIRFDASEHARITTSATRQHLHINGQHVRDAYERRFFRADPNRAVREAPTPGDRAMLRRLRPDSIADESYRFHCFDLPALVDRLSLVVAQRGLLYCLNLYRCSCTGPFTDPEIEAVQANGPLLVSLAVKHDELSCRNPSPNDRGGRIDDLVRRLAAARKKLTSRELEIAARIVVGMSSRAIALDLGIGQSSVITYRKRAYGKLGISTQNELFALCYFG